MRPVLGGEMRRRAVRATLSSTLATHTHTYAYTRMPPNYNRMCMSVDGWQVQEGRTKKAGELI